LAKSAVADAAPIIAFACIGRLALLPQVLGQVLVPETVARECLVTGQPGAEAIGKALAANLLIRHPDAEHAGSAFPQLDAGETAAIRLAQNLKAALLIDERLGRAVARRLGVPVIGSLGVLIAGKRLGLIESVGSIITQMRENGYYIADALVSEALLRAGELER
jgi:predicted nucleic acid-binding protein